MAITSLHVVDFRNIAAAELVPCADGLNVIHGNNGSGKTSLLEAIHYLGLGRSFRTSTATSLIRHNADKFSIFSHVLNSAKRYIPIGIERNSSGVMRLRVAEKDASSIAELAAFLPIRVINSHSHQLFESGPTFRRKYLDWGLFYENGSFLPIWKSFERTLKQRNSILRDRRSKRELDVWTEELIKYGTELAALRRDYTQNLEPILAEIAYELLSISNLRINYNQGWDARLDYAAALANHHDYEFRIGYTQLGPHRADFDITIDGVSLRHFLSRGQQKLLICAMIIAQGVMLARRANRDLIYLIDDLPSELDLHSRQKLISLLSKQQTQIFITAIESETICDFIDSKTNAGMKVFHVEHGMLKVGSKELGGGSY